MNVKEYGMHACTALICAGLLSVGGPVQAADHTHQVNCDKPNKTLQKRIDKAHVGDTILVKGTCSENVIISKNRLTLVADGAAVIDGSGGPDLAAVEVRARNITIRGFTIIGGNHGIQISSTGSATIEGNDISGATVSAVHVTQSGYALVGGLNSAAGNALHSSLRGITVRNGASADVFFNTISNNDRGIEITANGAVDMADNIIDGHDRGLSLTFGGTATLSSGLSTTGGANTFANNTTAVRCRFGGSAGGGASGDPQIDGGGNGTLIDAGPTTGAASCHFSSSLNF